MNQTINIRGFKAPQGTILEIECNATPQIMVNAAALLLSRITKDSCPVKVWPHVQSAINCLSLISKHRDVSESEFTAALAEATQ